MPDHKRAAVTSTKRVKLPKGPSVLEAGFRAVWSMSSKRLCGEPEYQFDPVRKWRLDFAWIAEKVAVEIHGGTRTGGRHVRGSGIRDDCRKINAAILQGWRVLVYTSDDLRERPTQVVAEVELLLETKGAVTNAD